MKKQGLLYTFLITLPMLDLLSSISSRFRSIPVSMGMIIKGLAMVLGVLYVLFKSKSKYKKVTLFYLTFILLFIICYFTFKTDLLRGEFIFQELNYILKFIYFPVFTFVFLNIFDEKKFDKRAMNKIMLVSLVTYIVLIVLPTIFNINFNSYLNAEYFGSVGWFYSANEVSTILLLLFPFVFILNNKKNFWLLVLFFISLYTISLIGTKVTLFGILIITFLIFFASILKNKKILNKSVIITGSIFAMTIVFMLNNYSMINMKTSLSPSEENEIRTILEENEKYSNSFFESSEFLRKMKNIGSKLLSNRDVYAANTYYIYAENYTNNYLLFGMGFSNTERVNNLRVEKLIEIDFLDIYFHMGLVALLILIFPFVFSFYYLVKNRKKGLNKINIFILIMFILLTVGISSTAGHVYLAPAVSIYIAIYFAYLFNELKLWEKKIINDNKITFLALHMGYGGVENAIASISSMLGDKYEVEIVSLYKKEESVPFKINKNIKIKYLMNTTSNKQEFINCFKDRRFIEMIKEGFKACYILFNKKLLIKKEIINSDAKIIISTRISFSKLLNKWGREESVKIHQEHTYSVSDEYVKELNELSNIDYIMPASQILTNVYSGKVNKNIKYIPLALNYFPPDKEISKLDTKNLIFVGRLEKEKDPVELIYIINELVKKGNKDIFLNIFGDGSQKEPLKNLINSKNLNNYIKIWGFQAPDIIKKWMGKSSLFLLTSLEESFGLVLIESMSYGVPCIAYSSAEGAKDIIDNNVNGFLVKNRNRQEYIKKIEEYLKYSTKDKQKIRTEARKTSEKYKISNIKKEWNQFIKEILNEKVS